MIVLLTNACECACAIRTEVVNIFAGYLEIIYPFDGVLTKVECRQGLWRWGKEYATCAIYGDDEAYLIEDNYPDLLWFEQGYRLEDE